MVYDVFLVSLAAVYDAYLLLMAVFVDALASTLVAHDLQVVVEGAEVCDYDYGCEVVLVVVVRRQLKGLAILARHQ